MTEPTAEDLARRKTDHLDLAARGDVGFKDRTTLLECVRLVHDALPDCAVSDVDMSLQLFGKTLRAPLLIAAMTGGNPRAEEVNKKLAVLAEERGYALGLGSQRAMHKNRDVQRSYQVRDVAPNIVLLGNVGVVQARDMSTQQVEDLVGSVGADALCVHLNPAMELIQKDGDRDFRGGTEAIARLVSDLSVPVVAKETGCGLSAPVGRKLRAAGVRHVDVSGAGGTSWVGLEALRADAPGRALGEAFWDWGVPTGASVAQMAPLGFETIFATGGIKTGLDAARALALGATAAGIARPVLQALDQGGPEGARAFLDGVEAQLRAAMLLTGSRDLTALRACPRIVTGELKEWIG
jgi:isopentenyl-diphosphate delta-isomerase